MVPRARITASVTSDWRQPWTWTSQPASGMKMVLAKPATSVMTVSAWTRWRSNHLLAVANAGSYSVTDMTGPISAQTRYSSTRLAARDQPRTSRLAAMEPSVMSSRGPW